MIKTVNNLFICSRTRSITEIDEELVEMLVDMAATNSETRVPEGMDCGPQGINCIHQAFLA